MTGPATRSASGGALSTSSRAGPSSISAAPAWAPRLPPRSMQSACRESTPPRLKLLLPEDDYRSYGMTLLPNVFVNFTPTT
ncbi:MAG: hypothetical protein HC876_06360 [Chloroflexaceae bacterium]|nr:hypothetical protein [Chloroflexaceae bacterium]NJO05163.1 hypothetical protein [Chloroflexaceae bacterium]